jgi:long-subunit acyl-CoA synthetase (AMP-forming)
VGIRAGFLRCAANSRTTPGCAAEWVLVDSALHAYSMVSVPLYDTLGPEAVEYITNHAELSCVACSAQVRLHMLRGWVQDWGFECLRQSSCTTLCGS